MAASGEPLFATDDDGQTKNSNGVIIALNVLLVLFELFTITICVAFGIINKSPEHFVMGAVAISIFGAYATLMWWYRKGLLEAGRFKFLIILVLFGVLFASTAANMYVWKPLPIPSSCQYAGYFFSVSSQQCFEILNMEKCLQGIRGLCIELAPSSGEVPILVCRNCTHTSWQKNTKRRIQEPLQLHNIQAKSGVEGVMGRRGVDRVKASSSRIGEGISSTVAKRGVMRWKEIDTEENDGMKVQKKKM